MHFKTVAVRIVQPCYPWCICHMLTWLQPPPLLRFHVTQFGSTGSPLTCVFHSQRSAGLPYAKVTPWLWIGSTMFVLIGRLAASHHSPLPPRPTTPACRPAAREADEDSFITAASPLCPCARSRHNRVPHCAWPVHTSDHLSCVFWGHGDTIRLQHTGRRCRCCLEKLAQQQMWHFYFPPYSCNFPFDSVRRPRPWPLTRPPPCVFSAK